MLCPYCQRPVGAFTKSSDGRTLRCPLADCPGADFDVPNLYARDYEAHPPVAMSILGPTGHGKTMFIEALLTHLEQHVNWPDFSTQWMDEVGMREIRERLRTLRLTGQVANANNVSVFTRPKILRLRGVPRLGGRQLLMFDTGGEAFANADNMLEYGRYVRNSPAILWIVSLTDLEYPEQLGDLITSYAHAMDQMGADPREQALVVVLTKGDKFLGPPPPGEEHHLLLPELPAAARDFLENDDLDPAGDAWAKLDAVHEALDGWLQKTKLRGTVNLLKAQFRTVKFAIVSAQGAEAVDDALKMDLMPRGILAPLLWLLRVGKPSVWVETKAGRELHLDFAAAVEAAPDGALIRLERGAVTLDAPLNLAKSLTIVGTGVESCRIVSTAEKYAFGLAGAAVTFRGLTLSHAGAAPADVLRVKRGVLVLNDVEVRGGVAGGGVPGDGVLVLGPCEVHLSGSRLTENAGAGLGLRDPLCKANLKDCKLTRNAGGAVVLMTGTCVIAASTLANNARGGVEISKGGTLEIDGGTLSANGKFGVRSAPASSGSVTLKGVTVEGHADRGIDLHGTVTLSAVNLTCKGNKSSGVNLKDGCEATIRGGTFSGNLYGVVAAGKSKCQLAGATVSGNTDSGVLFAEQAHGTCLDNTCAGNGNGGLRVFGTARVAHRGNTFKDNVGGDIVPGPDAVVSVAPHPNAPPPPPPPPAPPKKPRGGWFG